MQNESWDVIIVGAGAAGLMAGRRVAERGYRTLLLEKNRKLGVKILMSGGTRCNVTHDATARKIAEAFPRSQRKFLGTALSTLPPAELLRMLHEEGVATKVEANGKVFPVSDRAIDVRDALAQAMLRSGCQVRSHGAVHAIERAGQRFAIQLSDTTLMTAHLIVACGGQSYPGCGTTGDGYHWARVLGHTVIPPVPALVALRTGSEWMHHLQGITMPDAKLTIRRGSRIEPATHHHADDARHPEKTPVKGSKVVEESRRGSLLLTHQGLSGPLAMNISRTITRSSHEQDWLAEVDFWPAINEQQCLQAIGDAIQQTSKKQVKQLQWGPLPRRLIDGMLSKLEIPPTLRAAEISKRQIQGLVALTKKCPTPILGSLGFSKAEVTAGGVSLDEVEPSTMQSRLAPNCYFVGEVLDIDGPIGGYNFQAAFSTGWLAGSSLR